MNISATDKDRVIAWKCHFREKAQALNSPLSQSNKCISYSKSPCRWPPIATHRSLIKGWVWVCALTDWPLICFQRPFGCRRQSLRTPVRLPDDKSTCTWDLTLIPILCVDKLDVMHIVVSQTQSSACCCCEWLVRSECVYVCAIQQADIKHGWLKQLQSPLVWAANYWNVSHPFGCMNFTRGAFCIVSAFLQEGKQSLKWLN